MPGPAPKDPSARRRVNKASTARVLGAGAPVAAPELPGGDWHDLTRAWWAAIWADPMAEAWLPSDVHRLVMLAMLVNDYWLADTASGRKELSGEIRLAAALFGLSPIDRRRLQWEVATPAERGAAPTPPSSPKPPPTDPRLVLVS